VGASRIASWDGSGWSPVGSGIGGGLFMVEELTEYDGKLIVGGSFTTAGGVAAKNIAMLVEQE
jgi:hypothetical protein